MSLLDTMRTVVATEPQLARDAPALARRIREEAGVISDVDVFDLLQRKGLAARITTDEEIEAAVNTPPQTTRAKLRGEFIKRAQETRRDFTVDWVHLKLNDQAQRTVLCKDPFRAVDERVDRLLELLASRPTPAGP